MGFVAFLLVAALLNIAGVLLCGGLLDFVFLMIWSLFAGVLLAGALFVAALYRKDLAGRIVLAVGVGSILIMLPFGSMALAALSLSLWGR